MLGILLPIFHYKKASPFSKDRSAEWHLRQTWAPALFVDDEQRVQRQYRNLILPTLSSASAMANEWSHQTVNVLPRDLAGRAGQPGESDLQVEIQRHKTDCQTGDEYHPVAGAGL